MSSTAIAGATSHEIRVRPQLDILMRKWRALGVVRHGRLQVMTNDTMVRHLLAQQWLNFEQAAEPSFRLVAYAGATDGTDDRVLFVNADRMQQSLAQIGHVLSRQDEKNALEYGFHIISFPLTEEWTRVPFAIASAATESASLRRRIPTCYHSAEPDARQSFTLKGLLEMTATSVLQFTIDPAQSTD